MFEKGNNKGKTVSKIQFYSDSSVHIILITLLVMLFAAFHYFYFLPNYIKYQFVFVHVGRFDKI